jgi:hypothetical protein
METCNLCKDGPLPPSSFLWHKTCTALSLGREMRPEGGGRSSLGTMKIEECQKLRASIEENFTEINSRNL